MSFYGKVCEAQKEHAYVKKATAEKEKTYQFYKSIMRSILRVVEKENLRSNM